MGFEFTAYYKIEGERPRTRGGVGSIDVGQEIVTWGFGRKGAVGNTQFEING
jgi:hypothetical protein